MGFGFKTAKATLGKFLEHTYLAHMYLIFKELSSNLMLILANNDKRIHVCEIRRSGYFRRNLWLKKSECVGFATDVKLYKTRDKLKMELVAKPLSSKFTLSVSL